MSLLKKLFSFKDTALTVSILLILTKVIGLLRSRYIATSFGASRELDIFWAASSIPDLVFNIVIAGTFSAAIIPVFTNVQYEKGHGKLLKLFGVTFFLIGVILIFFSTLMFFRADAFIELLLSANLAGANNYDISLARDLHVMSRLVKLLLVSNILLGLSSVLIAYLQVYRRFFVTMLAPFLYNVVSFLMIYFFIDIGSNPTAILMISYLIKSIVDPFVQLSMVDLFPYIQDILSDRTVILAISLVMGAFAHLIVQIPIFFSFVTEYLNINQVNKIGKKSLYYFKKNYEMFRLAIPRILSYSFEQITIFINVIIGFTLTAGALSAYKYATQLYLLPVQIFAGAVSQVALPDLSALYEKGKIDEFRHYYLRGLKNILFFVLPTSAVILVLRLPIVRLVYGAGDFTWEDTIITSWALALLIGAMIASSVVSITLRALFAMHETKWPLIASLVAVNINIILVAYLTNFFSHYQDWRPIIDQIYMQTSAGVQGSGTSGLWDVIQSFTGDLKIWFTTRNRFDSAVGGLSLALSISFLAEMMVLLIYLHKKIKIFSWDIFYKPLVKMMVSSLLMLGVMYVAYRFTDFSFDTTRTINVLVVVLFTSVPGGIIYIATAYLMKLEELVYVVDRGLELFVQFRDRLIAFRKQ